MGDTEKSREQVLEDVLKRVLAELHDATQVDETRVPGVVQRIHTKVLLDIIGDVVTCPDCEQWGEHEDGLLTDTEAAEILWLDREIAEEREQDRVLRQRP